MDFEQLYTTYFRKVYAFALSLSRNAHTAEEITQETFYRVLRQPDAFKGRSSLETYLCSIAHHQYISMLRKQKHIDFCIDTSTLSARDGMEEALVDRDTAQQLYLLLHKLEEPYKEVFTLRTLGELPYAQIGALFQKGEGWARVTYYRAKQKIQQMLQEETA